MPTITNPNFRPDEVINRKITIKTARLSDGSILPESHNVDWIATTHNLPLQTIGPIYSYSTDSQGNTVGLREAYTKYVVPLTDPNGMYFIKFHFPKDFSDVYITFAEKNPAMADGYWDYKSLIKQEFIDAFHTFVRDGRSNMSNQYPYSKTLKFSAYGRDTNQPSIAVQFSVEFKSLNGGMATTVDEVPIDKDPRLNP